MTLEEHAHLHPTIGLFRSGTMRAGAARPNKIGRRRQTPARTHRRGLTLLLCLFVMALVSTVLVGMLGSQTVQMTALRNTADYERALYLAGAGTHHALAEIENDPSWMGDIAPTEYPAGSGNTYAASAVPGAGNTIVVTGTGVAGTVTRKLQVTILPGS